MAREDRARLPAAVAPMLATLDKGHLPDDERFAYEFKYDGYRAVMRVAPGGAVAVTSRNDKDLTDEFGDLAAGLGDAVGEQAVLDGELVVLNELGQPEFGLMQERRGRYQQGLSTAQLPARYLVFDLLRLGGTDLTGETYDQRRHLLEGLDLPGLVTVGPAFTHDALAADGLTPRDLLERAGQAGYEGLISKRRKSRYYPGRRTTEWLKHPLIQTQEVIVCGWRPGKGRRTAMIGGLLLGAYDRATGDLLYLGDVGTGFTEHALRALQAQLEPLERRTSPFTHELTRDDARHARWVEPTVVGEVNYRQFTRTDRRLRHAAWRGLRPDRDPAEITAPDPTLGPRPVAPAEPDQRVTVQVGDRRLQLSNLDEPLYPDGTTKGEVINYYSRIAPLLLPHLAGRPVTLVGTTGEPLVVHAPGWVRTVRLPGTGDPHPLIEDLPGLVWAANLAAVELHTPQWTVDHGGDRLVFELDPGPGTTIVDCCRVAERLHDLLVADGLTPFATTSGTHGLRLYARTDDPSGAYAKAVARRLAADTPTATVTRNRRKGTVFVDWSQNQPDKATIAPYSLRGRDYPAVSTPVTWDEVRTCTDPGDLTFTPDDVLDRGAQLDDD